MENNEFQLLSQNELNDFIEDVHNSSESQPSIEYVDGGETEDVESAQNAAGRSDDSDSGQQSAENNVEEQTEPSAVPVPEKSDDAVVEHKVPSEAQRDALVERIAQIKRFKRTLAGTLAAMILIVIIATVVAAVFTPVIRVSGSSMEPTYQNGDIVVLFNSKTYESGQLCCISYQNKLLLKRVVALPGDIVSIDDSGNVYINSILLDEPYAINKSLGECDIEFPFQVPSGKLFVLGDRRDTSIDSRNTLVGCVDEDDIIGRVLFRAWPLGNN